jgi:hypothetical protein
MVMNHLIYRRSNTKRSAIDPSLPVIWELERPSVRVNDTVGLRATPQRGCSPRAREARRVFSMQVQKCIVGLRVFATWPPGLRLILPTCLIVRMVW